MTFHHGGRIEVTYETCGLFGEITNRKLSLDGENYLQWRKIIKIYVKGRTKKHHLTENPPMTDEWEQDSAQLLSDFEQFGGEGTLCGDAHINNEGNVECLEKQYSWFEQS